MNVELKIKRGDAMLTNASQTDRLFVYHGKSRKCIPANTIVMIQSLSNYSTIYLQSGDKILTSRTLKYWAGQLGNQFMVRTHQSFLINVESIISVENRRIQLKNNLEARISRNISIRSFMNQFVARPA
jgi:DNA-binding LytR/AlgR family response regulator